MQGAEFLHTLACFVPLDPSCAVHEPLREALLVARSRPALAPDVQSPVCFVGQCSFIASNGQLCSWLGGDVALGETGTALARRARSCLMVRARAGIFARPAQR